MPVLGTLPPSRFVILAAPRTGSNWLCTLLDSHPEVVCHHELFNPGGIHVARRLAADLHLGSVESRDRDPGSLIARVWRAHLGHRSVGFKLNRGQDPRAFEHVLGDRRLQKIVLRRRNRVRTFVSETIAERTGDWESYPGIPMHAGIPMQTETGRLHVRAAELLAHARRNEAYYEDLESRLVAAGRPWLEVSYERLGENNERERILRFLGVASAPLSGATRRQHPQPLRELIANFDELRAELRGTGLEDELSEPS